MAASLLAIVFLVRPPGLVTSYELPEQVAIVQNRDAKALWLIEVREGEIHVKPSDALPQIDGKDYELWMVATDGRAPISLGILPKLGNKTLLRPAVFDQTAIAALAVSLEPLGGSPTGQPTEVLYTSQLMPI